MMKLMIGVRAVSLICVYASAIFALGNDSENFAGYSQHPTLTGMLVCIRSEKENVVEFTPLPLSCNLKNVSWSFLQGIGKCSNQTYQIVLPNGGSVGGACLQGQAIALVTNSIDGGGLQTRDYGKFRILGSVVNPSNCVLGVTADQFPQLESLMKMSNGTSAHAMELLDNTLRYHLSPLAAKAKRALEDAGFHLDESPMYLSSDEKGLTGIRFLSGAPLTDLKPLKDMRLRHLDIAGTDVADLSLLQGMPLVELNISSTPVSNVCPLAKLPLRDLNLFQTKVRDISPLAGLPLEMLSLGGTDVQDLSPLQGMPIISLYLDDTPVSNVSPLAKLPLRYLSLSGTKVKDINPLAGLPLGRLDLNRTAVQDLSPLKGMSLAEITFDPQKDYKGIEVIREMKTLTKINGMSPSAFWTKFGQGEFRTNGPTVPVPRSGAPSGRP